MKKRHIIIKNSHSLCYFTPSKRQGRRNSWVNGLIGPPKFYHYQKKKEKTDQTWLFYDWPPKSYLHSDTPAEMKQKVPCLLFDI